MFGATLTLPSGFTVSGPLGVEVNVTSDGTTAVPFKVSFSYTLPTVVVVVEPGTGP